jgi:type VII secretion protein EccE
VTENPPPPHDADRDGEQPPPGGALYAARPVGTPTASPARDGVIGARPSATPAVEAVIPMPTATATVTASPARTDVESRSDATAPRAQLAQAARAAAQLAQASTSAAAAARPAALTWSRPHYWHGTSTEAARKAETRTPQPGRPRSLPRPATVLALHAVQIVAWQLAIIGVFLAVRQPATRMIPLLAGAGLLLAITVPRSGGRWVYQWLGVRLRFLFRRRQHTIPVRDSSGGLLSPFLRGVRLDTIKIDDVERALVTHAGGLSVVLQLAPTDGGALIEPAVTVPPPTVLLPLGDEVGPPVSAQLIVQTTPAPGAYGAQGVAAQSYQALARGRIPARRRSWIALQVLRTPGDTDETELRATLVRAVGRLQRRLRRVAMQGNVLDETQLSADVAALSGAETYWPDNGPAVVRFQEQWADWRAGPHPQVTYRLLEWPDLAAETGREFFDQLVTVPSVSTTIGIAARRGAATQETSSDGSDLELEAALRVTVPSEQTDQLARQLRDLAGRHGVKVQRMNGEHVYGVAASLPIGGFVT